MENHHHICWAQECTSEKVNYHKILDTRMYYRYLTMMHMIPKRLWRGNRRRRRGYQ